MKKTLSKESWFHIRTPIIHIDVHHESLLLRRGSFYVCESISSWTRDLILMKLGGYIEFIRLYCMGLFSTSGSDPEPEVARFPITSYMFYEKNISERDIETKVDTYLLRTRRVNCIHPQNFIRIDSRVQEESGIMRSIYTHKKDGN